MIIEVVGTGRIKKRKPIEYFINENGCWICTSHYIDCDGYPTLTINWRQRKMSRYMYVRFVGAIPDGHVIRHKCDVRGCINPDHLTTGTPKDNTIDMISRNRDKKACGEDNGQSKLKKAQVVKILSDTRTNSIIAKNYGVSRRCIRDIKSGKTWRQDIGIETLPPDEIERMNQEWGR